VGLTSPPAALLTENTPRFCTTAIFCHSATHGNQVSKTAPDFDLPNPQTLATRFLTNGVGATSPPVSPTFAIVIAPDFNEFAFRNSTRFQSFTALSIRHPLFSSTSAISKTRFKLRSLPFAFFYRPTTLVIPL
jgi:hypothetical protein